LIEYAFGPNSYQSHVKEAAASGARLEVCEIVRLTVDVDLPEDLALVREAQRSRPA
jgi:2-phospho-L-lactate guanylyltransferase (CobY/MobA/RfbA family)